MQITEVEGSHNSDGIVSEESRYIVEEPQPRATDAHSSFVKPLTVKDNASSANTVSPSDKNKRQSQNFIWFLCKSFSFISTL